MQSFLLCHASYVAYVPWCEKRKSKIRKESQSATYNYEKISNFVNRYKTPNESIRRIVQQSKGIFRI